MHLVACSSNNLHGKKTNYLDTNKNKGSARPFILFAILVIISFTIFVTKFPQYIPELSTPYSADNNVPSEKKGLSSNKKSPSNNKKPAAPVLVNQFVQKFMPGMHKLNVSSSEYKTDIWNKQESKRHFNYIKNQKYDFIVLPVQDAAATHDRVSRMMSARWIANSIQQNSNHKVMSPELFLRLVGGRATHFTEEDVSRIATKVGAKVVHLFANSVGQGNLTSNTGPNELAKLAVVLSDQNNKIIESKIYKINDLTKAWEFIDNKQQQPSTVNLRLLENAMFEKSTQIAKDFVDIKIINKTQSTTTDNPSWNLPVRLDKIENFASNKEQHAAYLQLFALLTPKIFEYERRRLFERSLLALRDVSEHSINYNLLTARALFHLYRRPQAIKQLSTAKNSAEKALKAYLNGNYTSLLEHSNKIDNQLLKVSSFIELNALHLQYDKKTNINQAIEHFDKNWKFLLSSAFKDTDGWYTPNNLTYFTQINGLFPQFDKTFLKILKEQSITGDLKVYKQDINIMEIVFNRTSSLNKNSCCSQYAGTLEIADVWALYKNLAQANVLQELYRITILQGNYSHAIEFSESIEPVFIGHPRFMRLYVAALLYGGEEQQEPRRSYLFNKAYTLSESLNKKAGGIDYDSLAITDLRKDLRRYLSAEQKKTIGVIGRGFSGKFYPSSILYDLTQGYFSALPYTNSSLSTLHSAKKFKKISEEKFSQQLQTRFEGHPGKIAYLADQVNDNDNDQDKAVKLLLDAIKNGADEWSIYNKLAETYIENSQYSNAKDAYLKYPYFKKQDNIDRIQIANQAYIAGSRLFWLGSHKESRPLYSISSSQRTGAGSELAARQRLALLDGDYNKVIGYAYQRGQRYNDIYGFRDYLAYLHIVGLNNDADAGFRALAPRFRQPNLWTSQFVGDRISNKTLPDIDTWLKSFNNEATVEHIKNQTKRYQVLQSVTDRDPALLASTQLVKPQGKVLTNNRLMLKTPLSRLFSDKYLGTNCDKSPPCDVEQLKIPSSNIEEYSGFIHAYQQLNTGQFEASFKSFIAYDFYNNLIFWPNAKYALPYFTLSASKVISKDELKKLNLLMKDKEYGPNFDTYLSRAVIEAKLSNTDLALSLLDDAFNNRPHTGTRPIFSWYQITEIAEWLYKETGDKRFIIKALAWAKRYQVIQPQFGWAFAFEARYSEVKKDRIRAAGYASYLDNQSFWLKMVPAKIKKSGQAWWTKNKPFLLKKIEKDKEKNKNQAINLAAPLLDKVG